MAKIAPSILSADFANLQRDIQNIKDNGADIVHVDVMDGIFVPNISIGIPVVQAIRPVTDLPLDVHLMIDRPIRYVEQFVKAGADYVTIHVEADQPQNTLEALDKIRALGCKACGSRYPLSGKVRHDPGDDRGAGFRRSEIHGRYDAQGHTAERVAG